MNSCMPTRLFLLLVAGQLLILSCVAEVNEATGDGPQQRVEADSAGTAALSVVAKPEQEEITRSSSPEIVNKPENQRMSAAPESYKNGPELNSLCGASPPSREQQESEKGTQAKMLQASTDLPEKPRRHKERSDATFLSYNNLYKQQPAPWASPYQASLAALQYAVASMLQPIPLFYFPLVQQGGMTPREGEISGSRPSVSGRRKREGAARSENGEAESERHKSPRRNDGLYEAPLTPPQKDTHSSGSPRTTVTSSQVSYRGDRDSAPSSHASKRRDHSSSSKYSSYPSSERDGYDPLGDDAATLLPYYARGAFPLPLYFPRPVFSQLLDETSDETATKYFYDDDFHYSARDLQGQRELQYFPTIHTGDHNGFHERPSRHEYEHRRYGSHYNHGMDRFFY
ncbi:hypothetical protein BESB_027910 [Besnoitia besnoiti]|uniref:Transmembrane protein n=1 Tax=Besnoitia besnoiti TaxID=94643 RepID=A0A2A9M649_BESBE|nr:uncharacterized protein BESB_027910 [Besnoitia besnoiti]PFH31356.1 hypothetical protein BESB_027910 [Besnoitia besnoiti]